MSKHENLSYKNKVYYPKLDGLRGIACISVLFFHSNLIATYKSQYFFILFKSGYLGVDLFFVLSGFLITSILISQYVKEGKIKFLPFFYKRMLRLYPPIILASIIFLVPLLFFNKTEALSNMFFLLTYTSDCVRLFQILIPSLQYPFMFAHTWSLAIEEQFYLFYPFLLNFLLITSNKKSINLLSSFWIYLPVFLLMICILPIFMGDWFYKFFIWRFFEIFCGCYVALLYSDSFKSNFISTPISRKTAFLLDKFFKNRFVLIISIILFFLLLSTFLPFGYLHYFIFTIICSVLLVNALEEKDENFVFSFLNKRWLIYVGKISYGVYLYHWPIFKLSSKIYVNIEWPFLKSLTIDAACIGLTFILAVLSYKFVEVKFLALKDRISLYQS